MGHLQRLSFVVTFYGIGPMLRKPGTPWRVRAMRAIAF
jgi:hypothetical protein